MLSFVVCLFRGGWQQFGNKLLHFGTTTLFIHSTPWCIGYQTKNMYTISAVSASIGETSWPIFGAVAGVLFVSLEVVVRKKMKSLEKPNHSKHENDSETDNL
jgi:hypothetical protein